MFCHASLGSNEAIEHFSVGRRLAFDAAKGRLWAVCRSCERWNLTPVEERWEAIEECERMFRDTKLRVSTANIGLARVKEGTTLVRIGDPQRPEMAAWRYGDQFNRRRRKYQLLVASGVVAAGGVVVAGPVIGLVGATALVSQLPSLFYSLTTVASIPVGGKVLRLTRMMVQSVSIRPSGDAGFEIEVPYKADNTRAAFRPVPLRVSLTGDDAIRAARLLLPKINKSGGRASDVGNAVDILETARGSSELFARYAFSRAGSIRGQLGAFVASPRLFGGDLGHICAMPAPVRLALEMSLHEDDERRALEGELGELETRWREAEEVAAIADDMFLPSGVGAMLNKLKGRNH